MTVKALLILLNKWLTERTIPGDWTNSLMVLLHKNGDKHKLQNYRPTSLLLQVYKLLTKTVINRLENKLEYYHTTEQAGFQKTFSTYDH